MTDTSSSAGGGGAELDSAGLARSLGAAIRTRRRALGLTLTEVAARCGLSQPFLSKVERGVGHLSMPSIDRVAKALGTTAVGLMAGLAGGAAVDVLRRDEHTPFRAYSSSEGTGRLLTRRAGQLGVVEFEDGPTEFPDEPYRHRNDSVCVIVAGCYEFEIDGVLELLHSGDSLSAPGGVGVRYRAVERPARMMLVFVSEDAEVVHRPVSQPAEGATSGATPGRPARRRRR